jgi:hypothetical protein
MNLLPRHATLASLGLGLGQAFAGVDVQDEIARDDGKTSDEWE